MNRQPIESPYYSDTAREAIKTVGHREAIGGMWEEMGQRQFDLLLKQGLDPGHRMLDIGCGCLRGGLHFVEYLLPGGYFGIDMHQDLLDAGYDIELAAAGLQDRMPRKNLLCVEDFDATAFGVEFDFALAQSVFTHLSLNKIRICLERLAPVMGAGAKFVATYFPLPASALSFVPRIHAPTDVTTFADQDPYHYRFEDLAYLAGQHWQVYNLGDWNHPRGQHAALFVRR